MRLVAYFGTKDLDKLANGVHMALALTGIDGITFHFDPDNEEVTAPKPVVVEAKPVDAKLPPPAETAGGRVVCDNPARGCNCGRSYKTKASLKTHLRWVKEKRERQSRAADNGKEAV